MKRILLVIAFAALLTSTASTALAHPWEATDIFGQGMDGEVVSEDGAKIHRTGKAVSASVTMPTPEPGSYMYPQGPSASGEEGHPEAFSLWMFVFFNPQVCDGDCDGPDLMNKPDVVAGAFNAGGHLVGGPQLTIGGTANEQSPTFGGANAETISEALTLGYDIADAEIHLAVAPHGALAPNLLPAQITTPVGDPSFWWLAIFG